MRLFEYCPIPILCSFTTILLFQQWIALVTTPQGWKMPEKSKVVFENAGPPEEKFQYSFCEVRERVDVNMTERIINNNFLARD